MLWKRFSWDIFKCDVTVRDSRTVYIMLLYRSMSIAELPSTASDGML